MSASTHHPHLARRDNGPKELADVVVHLLHSTSLDTWLGSGWWSEAELRQLIEVAFFTSLAPEEGRYPRCSLFWSEEPLAWFDIGWLRPEEVLDVTTLRKLAPICQTRNTAIRVALREDRLALVGLTAMGFEGLDVALGQPWGIAGGHAEPNVQVHIIGPGHIRINCVRIELELRAGQIQHYVPLWGLPPVRALATEFAASVGDKVIATLHLGDEGCTLFGGLHRCMPGTMLLQRILRPIFDGAHGGAVLVIPSRDVPWLHTSLGPLPEVAGLDLTPRAVAHLAACVDFHYPREVRQDLTRRSERWLQTRGRLSIAARAIGELAAVDGCVVLDRALSVIGFGTKITVSREEAERSPIQFKDLKSGPLPPHETRLEKLAGPPVRLDELEKLGGMRLRSALWLCKRYPNVVAFVVSQDQDLKVLWSENEAAFALGSMLMPIVPQLA